MQRAVEQQTPGALAQLKALAEADYAPAQDYLGKLYENGLSGVTVNLKEARRWTARAAENGEASAMHNLAMFLFHGDGGVMDQAVAMLGRADHALLLDSATLDLRRLPGGGITGKVPRVLPEGTRAPVAAPAPPSPLWWWRPPLRPATRARWTSRSGSTRAAAQ